jgi:sirohydrochlorin ferrochelatase
MLSVERSIDPPTVHGLLPTAMPTILLVDNGSLEPAATLGLRAVAAALSDRTGRLVEPVSLLHSSAVPAEALGGIPAEILEPALEKRLMAGEREFVIVPLFLGPSGALTDYLPKRLARLKAKWPDLVVRVGPPVAGSAGCDPRLVDLLEAGVRGLLPAGETPAVALVDHGSPARAVTALRDAVAAEMQRRMGADARVVRPASMERRPGPEYAFADPLLEHLLDEPDFAAGTVILAMFFLLPGRHAGPEGDVAQICAAARSRHPGLRTLMTPTLGTHPGLTAILADRLAEALSDR